MSVMDELPPTVVSKIDWPKMRALAEANPGKWIETPVSVNPSVATQIKAGKYASIKPEGLHIATRKDPEDPTKSYVYVRVAD